MSEVLVYSANFGKYDIIRKPVVPGMFRLFTDRSPEAFPGWDVVELFQPNDMDARRFARYFKTLGMPTDTEYTIWVDGNEQILVSPETLVNEWLVKPGADIALFRHPITSCIYKEAEICKRKGKDNAQVINRQIQCFRALGFPEGYGMAETPIVARKVGPWVEVFNQLWWDEIHNGSVRDQLSFDYVRWHFETKKPGVLKINLVDGGPGWKKRKHPWFKYEMHGKGGA